MQSRGLAKTPLAGRGPRTNRQDAQPPWSAGSNAVTHEYGDPFSEGAVAAAAARTLALRSERPGQPLGSYIERAVHECVCACAVEIEDGIERGRSGIHESLVAEVTAEVTRRIAASAKALGDAAVDEASDQSFPASDPPGWIWRAHEYDPRRT